MGSRAGSPNRNKAFLIKRLQDMYGEDFDPVVKMAGNAVTLQKIADDHSGGKKTVADNDVMDASRSAIDAINAWDKVAAYVESKLKAIEVSGPTDENGLPTSIEVTIKRD